MTDYRGTEQGLWDEDAIADENRPTLVVPQRGAALEVADELAPLSRSGGGPAAAPGERHEGGPSSVESVARFIAEPGLIAPSAERELDAPRRSIAALELLDAEYGAEPSGKRAPPLPPALPDDVRPRTGDLPSMLLGPQISTRNDVTERMTAIPMTHPLANSIAPGGSPVSAPPGPPKRSSRSQLALGALALLAIGAGASGFLQSRGEHHAASGRRSDREDDAQAEGRRDDSHETRAKPNLTAPLASEAAHLAHASRAIGEPLAASLPEPAGLQQEAPTAAAPLLVDPARQARPGLEPVARAAKVVPARVRIRMGGAALQPRTADPAAGELPAEPQPLDREQVVAAMNALTPQLRACVGEEHGVADVTLTVRAPGVVSHALVEGPFAGSTKGSCIARTLRAAKLPPFSEAVSHVEYPLQF